MTNSAWDALSNPTPEISGSMWGRIRSVVKHDSAHITLTVDLPLVCDLQPPTGLFFLIRCGISSPQARFTNWSHYLPLPMFAMQCRPVSQATDGKFQAQSTWQLTLDTSQTTLHGAATEWLMGLANEDSILISGPFGNRFLVPAPETRRNLLVLSQGLQFLPLVGAIHACLDAGGRVTLAEFPTAISKPVSSPISSPMSSPVSNYPVPTLAAHLPIQVEIQQLASLHDPAFTEMVRWADTLLVATTTLSASDLAYAVGRARFQTAARRGSAPRPHDEFAYVLVQADYVCGYGACLACTVATAGGGVTRACIHGPIVPLSTLATS